MKKKIIIVIVLIIIIIGIVILFQINIQNVETSKKIYHVGEKISYSWSDFRLYRCQVGSQIEFYKLNNGEWEYLPSSPMSGGGFYCLDGIQQSYLGSPMCCGECKLFDEPNQKKSTERTINIFEKIEDGSCENSNDKTLPSFKSMPAPAGIYKIQFGQAETTFEIK